MFYEPEYTDGKELGKLNKQGGGERLAANPFRRIPWYRASEEVPSYNFIKVQLFTLQEMADIETSSLMTVEAR